MTFAFRSVGNKHWYSSDQPDFKGWLPEGELVADSLKGLGTTGGSLSVYRVDTAKLNFDRVISAYACTRNILQDIDCVLVPLTAIEANFDLASIPGNTADDEVNLMHLDIRHISATKLVLLARIFREYRADMHRIRKKAVASKIRECLRQEYLDLNRINKDLRPKFTT